MKILLDENFPLALVRRLQEEGYHVDHIMQVSSRCDSSVVSGCNLPRRRRLEGQHPLLIYRPALLAAPPEQAMRQQLDPLAQRGVLLC